jgi:hypothetical protein
MKGDSTDAISNEKAITAQVEKESKKIDENQDALICEMKPIYYPPLPRTTIPLLKQKENTIFSIGSIVNISISVNWALQQDPVYATITSLVGEGKALKKNGRITRLKIKVNTQIQSSILAFYSNSLASIEFVEIHEINTTAESKNYFYCDIREILQLDSRNETIQFGDEVEFWSIPGIENIAFHCFQASNKLSTRDAPSAVISIVTIYLFDYLLYFSSGNLF